MAEESVEGWKRRFERERAARKNAEKLLEEKSLEIWQINQDLERQITERTAELEEALHNAQGANRAKDAFLSSMSHELRTPLNAIIGFSQILMAKTPKEEGAYGFLEKIQIAGKSLLTLVNTILDFSKIESGKMEFFPERFDLEKMITECEALIEPLRLKKRITVAREGRVENQVWGDSRLLRQALLNLLSNAVKFSPQGSTVQIESSFDPRNDLLTLSVRDEGSGIDEEKIQTLFQPFTQLTNARYVDEAGTGLGLMIIQQIARIHEGEAGAKNNPSGGATFWIAIPQKNGSERVEG